MMATKSARTCGVGKRAQTVGKAGKAGKAGKQKGENGGKGGGRAGPGRAREASHRGLVAFSAAMVEEKAP
jgi:hypothetical protein